MRRVPSSPLSRVSRVSAVSSVRGVRRRPALVTPRDVPLTRVRTESRVTRLVTSSVLLLAGRHTSIVTVLVTIITAMVGAIVRPSSCSAVLVGIDRAS